MQFIHRILYRIRLFLLRRALKKSRRQRRVVTYDQASSLVLLYEIKSDGSHDFINDLIAELQADGKTVYAIGFASDVKQDAPGQVAAPGILLNKKSFSLLMNLRDHGIREQLFNDHYDVLLDITGNEAIQMKKLAVQLPAAYKAGASHPDFLPVYDLLLEVKSDCAPSELAKHAIHYLKIIKTPTSND